MQNILNRGINLLARSLLKFTVPKTPRDDLQKFGSGYGGWVIPTSLLSPSSICYCVGVGEDISFDMALIETFKTPVFAFDPTPRALRYVQAKAGDVPNYHFLDVGVWSEDRLMRFYKPRDQNHVSYSVVNLQNTSDFIEANFRSLPSLMAELGHNRIDLLKLDVEGAEYEILKHILQEGLQIEILCVEFDVFTSTQMVTQILRASQMLRKLRRGGYTVVNADGWNYTLVRDNPWR